MKTERSATGSAAGSRSRSTTCRAAASAFGARVLPTDQRASEQAKYLNTAETPIYRKHEVLYNLHRARQAVAADGRGVRGRGLHRRDRAGAGRDRERGRDLRHGAGGGALPAAPGSRQRADPRRSTPTRPAHGPPSGRSRFQEQFPVTGGGDDHARRAWTRPTSSPSTAPTPCSAAAEHGPRPGRVHAAAHRSSATTCPRSRASPRRWPTPCRSSSASTIPSAESEYAGLLADLAGVSHASVAQSLDAHPQRQARRGRVDHEARYRARASSSARWSSWFARGDLGPDLAATIDESDFSIAEATRAVRFAPRREVGLGRDRRRRRR